MIHFLSITIQSKSSDDFRAFLDWGDDIKEKRYQLRGYGETPGEAATDAWKRYNADRDFFITHEEDWNN